MPTYHHPEELAAWLRLAQEPGVGVVTACALLRAYGLPQAIYAQTASTLARLLPQHLASQIAAAAPPPLQARIDAGLEWANGVDQHILTLADPTYPQTLLTIADPPLLLYVHGQPGLLNQPTLAIVGARNATPLGCENAHAFAHYLARHGWCIVSGLALGIDTAAHQGALAAGNTQASTIAVLGTGIDRVYPAGNRHLAHDIATQGALVSEFPLGTSAQAHHFPRRNRLVAGLARGVLVVEAAAQSGSLITAGLAGEHGREVFAIPGSIHSPLSRGCHALIRQGAKLVETARDITDELGTPADARAAPPAAVSTDLRPVATPGSALLDALGYDPQHPDQLAARTGLDITQLNAQLLELELDGWIARLDGGRYQRRC